MKKNPYHTDFDTLRSELLHERSGQRAAGHHLGRRAVERSGTDRQLPAAMLCRNVLFQRDALRRDAGLVQLHVCDRLRRRIDQRMDPDTQNPLAEHQRRRLGLWGYPTVRKLNVFIEKMETAPGRRSRPDGPHGRGPLPPGIRLFQHGQALRRRASDPESAATFRFARRALPETRDRRGRLPVHSRRDERHHRQPAAPRRIRSSRSGTTDTLCRRRIEKPSRDVRG